MYSLQCQMDRLDGVKPSMERSESQVVKVFGRYLHDDVNRETLAKRAFYHDVNLKFHR